MAKKDYLRLSNRERQIMDILYRDGSATAAEVHEKLRERPSYSSVRATLRILEEKGQVRHEQDGPRYVFRPTVARDKAKRTAIRHLLSTFFDGSTELAVATLLDESASQLSEDDFKKLKKLIDEAESKKRGPMMETLVSLGQSFGGMILVKSTFVLSLVFASSVLLRNAAAASRHFLWTLCFIALLALPVATYVSAADSSWRIPVPILSPA